ncbi:MAG: beta-galactosidase [Candidatus Aminicenantes bacterium]|nr:MAG: beta-galactosidase [Candidatus Aminicenantes bacterium]
MIMIAGIFCSKETAIPEVDWHPVEGKIMTQWAKDVSPDSAHPEYPRPQMKREEWLNMNGMWEYAILPEEEKAPERYDGYINVPFPVESALSGVKKPVGKENRLWYRRSFTIPKNWSKKRILLNFEAVDWETTVWINGRQVGTHLGGYDPFTFDITDALKKRKKQEVILSVWDPIDEGTQPRGKQVRAPRGIWYTSVTGIWGTVWLEPVEKTHIESLKIIPDIDTGEVQVVVHCPDKAQGYQVEMVASREESAEIKAKGMAGKKISLFLQDPQLWSPDSPNLYDLKVLLKDSQDREIDHIESYFGMRKISVGKDEAGINRLFLNNHVQFMIGPLDQGWWPDGLYTAPTDEALRYDLEVTRQMGMNMLRKHVKVEPRRFYYWCDKLGVLVWQDMPNGDAHIGREGKDIQRSPESAKQFEAELNRMIDSLYNHPSIVMWVPFNEGWGQYDTTRLVDWIKQLDPTRLVNNASGWADRGAGDVHDVHSYPGPDAPTNEPNRAAVLGEFGGLGLPINGHTWQDEKNWGYRSFENAEELTQAYRNLIQKLKILVEGGLSAAVYTQTTDVEIEVNGLMTYDRAITKMDPDHVANLNKELTKQ